MNLYLEHSPKNALYARALCTQKHTIDTAQQGPMSVNGHWTHRCVSIKSLSVSFSGEDECTIEPIQMNNDHLNLRQF